MLTEIDTSHLGKFSISNSSGEWLQLGNVYKFRSNAFKSDTRFVRFFDTRKGADMARGRLHKMGYQNLVTLPAPPLPAPTKADMELAEMFIDE